MTVSKRVGIEQARASLPAIVADAHAGKVSVVTRHGKPYAAIVPVAMAVQRRDQPGILSLRGTGRGLWGDAGRAVRSLRAEWD